MTWNTRALLTADERLFHIKWATIERGLGSVDVLCAQETHGSATAMELLAARSAASHRVGWSECASSDADGVMTWVRRSICADPPKHEVLVPGRIMSTAFRLPSGRRLNFEVPSGAIRLLAGRARHDAAMGTGTWVLQGDWNFGEPGGNAIRVGVRGVTQLSRDTTERRRWRDVLVQAMELLHGCDTLFSGDACAATGEAVQSSLVRAAISLTSGELSQIVAVTYSVPPPSLPGSLAARRSDHIPITTVVAPRQTLPASARPVPKWASRHPLFPKFVEQHQLRCAAAATRGAAPSARPLGPRARAQRAMQTIRIVCRSVRNELRRQARRWPELKPFLGPDSALPEPRRLQPLFEFLGTAVRAGHAESIVAEGQEPPPPAPGCRRGESLGFGCPTCSEQIAGPGHRACALPVLGARLPPGEHEQAPRRRDAPPGAPSGAGHPLATAHSCASGSASCSSASVCTWSGWPLQSGVA